MSPLVTVNQAAQLAGVSRRTIYYWIEGKKIDTVRTAGGHLRIFSNTLFRRDNQPIPAVEQEH